MLNALQEAINDGYGDKKILLSGDDEGNSFHECFFGITKADKYNLSYSQLPYGVTIEDAEKDYVILG